MDLSFDNSEFTDPEMESKAMILETMKEMLGELNSLSEEKELGLGDIFEIIHNKISIEAQIGNWTTKANINIKNLNKLLTAKFD